MSDALIIILLLLAIGGSIWAWEDNKRRINEIEARIKEHEQDPPQAENELMEDNT